MSRPLDTRLDGIGVTDVTTWLGSLGWTRRSFPREDLLVFDGPADDFGAPLTATLPSDDGAPDFHERLTNVIKLVAAAQGRDLNEMLTGLLSTNVDGVSVPLERNRPEVGVAARCVRSGHPFVLAVASSP